jgi:hypothetical protein
MSRAGREPAEDLKRRLVAACQEVGLTVTSARMILQKDQGHRIVHVAAAPDCWPHESPMLTVMATISVNGKCGPTVDIRCCATDDNPLSGNTPWMKGRGRVAREELVEQLRDTLDEREKVIAAMKCGIEGPYKFELSVWQVPDLLSGLDFGG